MMKRVHCVSPPWVKDFSLYRLPVQYQNIVAEIVAGLRCPQKQLPARLLYNDRGLDLYDALAQQPEHYLTRAEQTIFTLYSREIREALRGYRVLIEPGCGRAAKTQALLGLLEAEACVLIDLCENPLISGALQIASEYPNVHVHALCADYTDDFFLPEAIPQGRRLAYFPGSSLGTLEPTQAERFLQQLRGWVGDDGGTLISIDCNRDKDLLLAANNDVQGATAEFNLNLLNNINSIAETNFDPQCFAHFATYNEARGRVEMHLHSRIEQQIHLHGQTIHFDLGESIRTENSYKFLTREFVQMAERSGFEHYHSWQDPNGYVSLHYLGADPISFEKLHLPDEQEIFDPLMTNPT